MKLGYVKSEEILMNLLKAVVKVGELEKYEAGVKGKLEEAAHHLFRKKISELKNKDFE